MKTNKKSTKTNYGKGTLKVKNYLRGGCLFILVASLQLLQPLMANNRVESNLVTTEWLVKNLKDPDLLLLDASPTEIFMAKHIPGAINVDYYFYGIRNMTTDELEKFFQLKGISSDKKIVIYDEGGTMFATRLFFSLYYYGFPVKNLLILDGGLTKWEKEGFSVTKEIPSEPAKGTFTIQNLNKNIKAELPEFLTASGDLENNVLLEALEPNWHYGEVMFFDRAGHIPNAIMMPRADFYNPDKTFKSPEEIQKMLEYMGIKPDQNVYTHCGGGVAATVPFFALKFMLNYPGVKLYEGSEREWLADERKLPYWTYDKPNLIRESNWLNSWAGKISRSYFGTQVSIVDVRQADEHNKGHLPFALNISADLFKKNLANPAQLAEILGPAGVNVEHEAVLISGGGITKEAALSFVLLEEMGQNKVSLFIDSLEKWKNAGYELTKEKTVVGAKKNLYDLSIPPTTYPNNLHKNIIIRDINKVQGIYPKILIAAGINMPTKSPEGKVVHVPYSELLTVDGRPKAAKEIWKILESAGVPRYAEIICFSDDPGEAAVDYFILKIMGFPNLKLLVK